MTELIDHKFYLYKSLTGLNSCNIIMLIKHLFQMIMLEGAKATTETVDALRTGAAAMKAMQKAT